MYTDCFGACLQRKDIEEMEKVTRDEKVGQSEVRMKSMQ